MKAPSLLALALLGACNGTVEVPVWRLDVERDCFEFTPLDLPARSWRHAADEECGAIHYFANEDGECFMTSMCPRRVRWDDPDHLPCSEAAMNCCDVIRPDCGDL